MGATRIPPSMEQQVFYDACVEELSAQLNNGVGDRDLWPQDVVNCNCQVLANEGQLNGVPLTFYDSAQLKDLARDTVNKLLTQWGGVPDDCAETQEVPLPETEEVPALSTNNNNKIVSTNLEFHLPTFKEVVGGALIGLGAGLCFVSVFSAGTTVGLAFSPGGQIAMPLTAQTAVATFGLGAMYIAAGVSVLN